jgi:hypothetical protein
VPACVDVAALLCSAPRDVAAGAYLPVSLVRARKVGIRRAPTQPASNHRARPQELALLEYGSLQFEPSAQAAAALMVAQIAQKQAPSCELLCSLSGHGLEKLKE